MFSQIIVMPKGPRLAIPWACLAVRTYSLSLILYRGYNLKIRSIHVSSKIEKLEKSRDLALLGASHMRSVLWS